jgi:hypothetical protein
MNKLTQRQIALISIAVGELIERLETQGDEYDTADLAILKEVDGIITGALTK